MCQVSPWLVSAQEFGHRFPFPAVFVVRVALTEHRRLGGLQTTEIYFPWSGAGGSRTRASTDLSPVKAHFLVPPRPHGWEGQGSLWDLLC